jgi:hypothetical protein
MKGKSLEKYLTELCADPHGLIMLLMSSRQEKANGTRMKIMIKDGILVMDESKPSEKYYPKEKSNIVVSVPIGVEIAMANTDSLPK